MTGSINVLFSVVTAIIFIALSISLVITRVNFWTADYRVSLICMMATSLIICLTGIFSWTPWFTLIAGFVGTIIGIWDLFRNLKDNPIWTEADARRTVIVSTLIHLIITGIIGMILLGAALS